MRIRKQNLFPPVVAVGMGTVILMINGLPLQWSLPILGGVLIPGAALMIPAPRRFMEIALMLSFGLTLDVHLFDDPTHRVDPGGIPVSLTGLVVCALTGWWVLEKVRSRSRQPLWHGLGVPMAGLWAASIWSIVGSPEPRFGFYGLVNMGAFTLMFLYLVNNVTTRDHLRSLLGWLMIAVALTSGVALFQVAFGRIEGLGMLGMVAADKQITSEDAEVLRVGGLMGSANGLATVLAQILPLIVAFFLNPKAGFRKPLLAIGLSLGILALIATYSRGGWLAFGMAFLLLLALMNSRHEGSDRREFSFKTIATVVTLMALLAVPLIGNIYERLTADDRGSAYSRITMAQVAGRMIKDNPFFGVGLGNYEHVMYRYDQGPERAHQNFPWPVHNIYLNITAETGLFGGFFFLLAVTLALWQGVQAMRTSDPFLRTAAIGLMVGLFAFLVDGMKELGPLGAPSYRFFWLVVGFLVATRRLARETADSNPSIADRSRIFDRIGTRAHPLSPGRRPLRPRASYSQTARS